MRRRDRKGTLPVGIGSSGHRGIGSSEATATQHLQPSASSAASEWLRLIFDDPMTRFPDDPISCLSAIF